MSRKAVSIDTLRRPVDTIDGYGAETVNMSKNTYNFDISSERVDDYDMLKNGRLTTFSHQISLFRNFDRHNRGSSYFYTLCSTAQSL
jgi:hypothetical protein